MNAIRRELHLARVRDGKGMDAGRYADDARHAAQAQVGGTITTSDGPDCQPEPAAASDEPEEWEMQA